MEITSTARKPIGIKKIISYLKKHWFIYMLVLPGILHTIIFRIVPIYGVTLAFKSFKMSKGINGSPWVGLKNFTVLFQDSYFYKVILNTVLINLYGIAFGTIFVIFLALMLNEVKLKSVKRVYQTFVYFPYFISWVVFAGIFSELLSPNKGAINTIISALGHKPIYFMARSDWFRSVIVSSGLIKTAGFSAIIYLASLAGVNPEQYESAVIDGANRGQMMWYISLPRIKPTIAVLLIMSVSNIFHSNFDQIYNFLNPMVMDTGDVLSTYLYRSGLLEGQFEKSTALGLVFSVLGLIIVVLTNKIISKMNVMGFF